MLGTLQQRTNQISTRNLRIEIATETVSDSTYVLTDKSPSQIRFSGNTAGQVIQLPSTEFLEAGHLTTIYNESFQSIRLLDADSNYITDLFPFQSITLTLVNRATQAGLWTYGFQDQLVQSETSTVNANVTTVQSLPIALNKLYMLQIEVTAVRTGGNAGSVGDCATYVRNVRVKNIAGVISIGLIQSIFTSEDQPGWNIAFSIAGSNLEIAVKGAVNNAITWNCSTKIRLLSF